MASGITLYEDLTLLDKFVERNNFLKSGGRANTEGDGFICDNSGEWVPEEWVCDGVVHCKDASHERHCSEEHKGRKANKGFCTSSEYLQCNHEPVCGRACDGRPDCSHSEDEWQTGCASGTCRSIIPVKEKERLFWKSRTFYSQFVNNENSDQ